MIHDSFSKRLEQLQSTLPSSAAYLLSHPSEIAYFTGFGFLVPEEREALLVVTKKKSFLIHTSFSPLPVNPAVTFLARCHPLYLYDHFQKIIRQTHISELFLDYESLFVSEYLTLKKLQNLTLKEIPKEVIWDIRMVKDAFEIESIYSASQLSAQSFQKLRKKLKKGMTEIQVSDMLEDIMRAFGSPKPAFPTIVAFGEHTAIPHHQPTNKKLENEMAVLIDFGATQKGYRSDMTRTFWFGKKPDTEFHTIESIVHTAYQTSFEKLEEFFTAEAITLLPKEQPKKSSQKPLEQTNLQTLIAKDLDTAARDSITLAGYGEKFTHTTGHGLGLEIHEQPSVSWANETPLKTGMVITIEPGIYLSGKFGYRYENTVVLKESRVSLL